MSEAFMTLEEAQNIIVNAERFNSTDTTIKMHKCAGLDGYCVHVRFIKDHELCEDTPKITQETK